MKRVLQVLCAMLLLTTFVRAGSAGFVMTVKNGRICVRDLQSGQWVLETQIREDSLSAPDRILLKTGLNLENKAECTRALEDFCS